MDKNKIVKDIEKQEQIEAYSDEMLTACQNGTPCSFGICDECPNILGNNMEDEDN